MIKCTKCHGRNTCTDALRYFNDLDKIIEKMKVNTTAATDIEKVLSNRRWDCERR